MRRLNVRPAQIDECIQKSLFAFGVRPHNPELRPGELLLLETSRMDRTILQCVTKSGIGTWLILPGQVTGQAWSR
jgi:hypothetical protein